MTLKNTVLCGALLALSTSFPASAQTSPQPSAPLPMASASSTVEANPALWKIKGVHGTVFLFGSVHVMKKNVHWETPKVAEAFKSSGTLFLELADTSPAATEAMKPVITSLGMDPAHPLSTKITKEDVAALDMELKKIGAPGESAVDGMQPWLVYLTLSVLPIMEAGYDPSSGVDRTLQVEAQAQGKTVKGFETPEEQIHYIADFPEADQVNLLHQAIQDMPKGLDQINEIMSDWEHGDVEKIAVLEDGEIKAKYPDLYTKLLVNRNRKIAATLTTLLNDPATGTVFVAVGAAHFAGPDSIQKMLAKSGYTAVRVE